ncbi:pyrophosphatase PpaX [Bacillus sp. DNRA2]|uniref:pyrophosphatase PpaX n=1 Tax=Bacillus sp. DNRA2 TaxID=2723053 RepID=UPI00145D17D7|nr:pyrophosphatase PpaX [Bacillus sp. DNRA2]NMD68897.1 pyrophosphatase PpaX [Bacillus sp. DNRA2]
MNNSIKTVLFDLDGTLIDTNDLIISSYLHTLDQYFPNQFKREDVLPFMGPSLHEVFDKLNPEKTEEMILAYRTFNKVNHDLLVKEFEGVYDTVKILKEKGYKLGVVTTKKLDVAQMGLNLAKLTPFFEVVIAIDHVNKIKPDPEPILKALKLLDATPEEALMVGDNYHDILGGQNAGTKTAGVAWSLKGRETLEQYKPDYILEKMTDLLTILEV